MWKSPPHALEPTKWHRFCTYTPVNVPHVYKMCDTYVIHIWCFMCITHLIHTPVIHVKISVIHMLHTCNTGVYPTHILHVQKYMCNICVYPTHVLHV